MWHRFIPLFYVLLAACSLPSATTPPAKDERSARVSVTTPVPPNIIIILADDLGFGDIGVNGASRINTPHIDSLAANGANFTHFYASANVCSPSRAGLMTGRYPIRTGLGYDVVGAYDERGLPAAEETLGELVRRANYRTKLIGKWHLGVQAEFHPLRHGWDEFYGVPHSNDMPEFALYDGERLLEKPVQQATLTQRYTTSALEFAERNVDSPFLLLLSHSMPHIPLYPSKQFRGRSKAGLYGDVVEEIDAGVGAIVATLRQRKLLNNTLIMFTSDNGPFFEGSVAGMKGGKGNSWEGGYRVPFVVSWPQAIKQGGTVAGMASNLDILPTIAEILNLSPKAQDIDGRSFLANLRDAEQASPHQYLYYFNNEEVVGLRTQDWKYLTHAYYRKSLGRFEKFAALEGFEAGYELLFKAGSADAESYSLADRHPETLDKLRSELQAARKRFDPYRTHEPDKTFPP